MDDHLGQLDKITYAEFHHVFSLSLDRYVLFIIRDSNFLLLN